MTQKIKAPAWLMDKEESKIFRQIVALDEFNLLTKADTILIAVLVDAIIDFRLAKADIEVNGVVIETIGERNHIRTSANPYIGIKNQAREMIRKTCQELGYTPKARAARDLVLAEVEGKGTLEKAMTELIAARAERRN